MPSNADLRTRILTRTFVTTINGIKRRHVTVSERANFTALGLTGLVEKMQDGPGGRQFWVLTLAGELERIKLMKPLAA